MRKSAQRTLSPFVRSVQVGLDVAAALAREKARLYGTKIVGLMNGEVVALDPDDPRLDARNRKALRLHRSRR